MTSLAHPNYATQHSGADRLTGVLASLTALFKRWASVRSELAEVGRNANLSPRAKRLMRADY